MSMRSNRRLVFEKGPQYPFAVWVPTEHSFDPAAYNSALRQAVGRNPNFMCIPVSADWKIWSFPDKAALDAFVLDLERALQSGVDAGT